MKKSPAHLFCNVVITRFCLSNIILQNNQKDDCNSLWYYRGEHFLFISAAVAIQNTKQFSVE